MTLLTTCVLKQLNRVLPCTALPHFLHNGMFYVCCQVKLTSSCIVFKRFACSFQSKYVSGVPSIHLFFDVQNFFPCVGFYSRLCEELHYLCCFSIGKNLFPFRIGLQDYGSCIIYIAEDSAHSHLLLIQELQHEVGPEQNHKQPYTGTYTNTTTNTRTKKLTCMHTFTHDTC